MTTAQSPLRQLKAQADKIAAELKKVERGDSTAVDVAGKLGAARQRDHISFAVFMDDKILTVDMTWAKIRESSEAGIAEYILGKMREERHVTH